MTRAERALELLTLLTYARLRCRDCESTRLLEQRLDAFDAKRGYQRGVQDQARDAFKPLQRGQATGKGWYLKRNQRGP